MVSPDHLTDTRPFSLGPYRSGGYAYGQAPGLLLLQVDGLSAPALESARSRGIVPILDRLVRDGHCLHEWSCGLPSDTLAVQTSLFWGTAPPAPSFAWWDRSEHRLLRAASASRVAAIEDALEASNGPGLMRGGSCHGAAIGGGAHAGALLPPDGRRSWRAMLRESGLSIVTSVVRGLRETKAPKQLHLPVDVRAPQSPAQSRLGRAIAVGVGLASRGSGHIVAASTCRDVESGRPVVFANLVEYDLVAHLAGPHSVRATSALASSDRLVGTILQSVKASPRPYWVVILSDHGITPATHAPVAFEPDPGRWIKNEWRRRHQIGSPDDITVAASGTVLQVWVSSARHRLDLRDLTNRAPGLAEAIARHPAVQATIVADGSANTTVRSYIVFGHSGGVRFAHRRHPAAAGMEVHSEVGVVERWGVSPFAPLGAPLREVEAQIGAYASRADIGDVTCIASPRKPRIGGRGDTNYWTFESQSGAHGGTGGDQSRPFVLLPPGAPGALNLSGGAVAMHEWLETLAPPR